MNLYIVILILISIFGGLAIIYFSGYSSLKNYKYKMDKAENEIDSNLNKKLDLIIEMNTEIKKVLGKKDYLKDYVNIKDLIITDIEKDLKLEDAEKLIHNLILDNSKLSSDEKMKKLITNLREINESLTSAKNIFNYNALLSNNEIKSFPNNLIAKLAKFNIRSFYNNKTDDQETF